jgi:hypothetical protein
MNAILRRLVVLWIGLLGISTHAAPLAVGDAVPAISAKDQHGAAFAFTNGTQFLLVATEMNSSISANKKLAEQGAGFLEKHSACYLMDIHTMPTVARWFAFPKMRKYPERIVFVDDAQTLAAVPVRTNCVTVLALTPAGRIQKIAYWNPDHEPATSCFP